MRRHAMQSEGPCPQTQHWRPPSLPGIHRKHANAGGVAADHLRSECNVPDDVECNKCGSEGHLMKACYKHGGGAKGKLKGDEGLQVMSTLCILIRWLGDAFMGEYWIWVKAPLTTHSLVGLLM